jgi:hypothetical protein
MIKVSINPIGIAISNSFKKEIDCVRRKRKTIPANANLDGPSNDGQ